LGFSADDSKSPSTQRAKLLNHISSAEERLVNDTTNLFKGIDLSGKRVLDVGAGNGFQSLYAAYYGADEVVAIDPLGSGSESVNGTLLGQIAVDYPQVSHVGTTLQDYNNKGKKFDCIILKNSINHLDEQACIQLQSSRSAWESYNKMFSKLKSLSSNGCDLVVRDASHTDFWLDMGVSNPFITSIDRDKHQPPEVWANMLAKHGFTDPSIRWVSIFGQLGHLSNRIFNSKVMSYLTSNVFVLHMKTIQK
jgi:cyclopropane fatty-acyl-phospholipid synthase-like methyltransferase